MLFDKVRIVCLNSNIQPSIRNKPTLIQGVFGGMAQRNKLVVLLETWKGQLRGPAYRFQRSVPPPLQLLCELAKFLLRRHLIKAANTHVDGMNLPATQERDNGIASLLHVQAALHNVGVVLRHVHGIRIAQKVGRMEHVDMQGMALDPFATVEQPPQLAKLPVNYYAEGLLHRMDGAHLVGDGTDAADASSDIGGLTVHATSQKRLEEARWLEDLQFHVRNPVAVDLHVERPLPFDASQVVHLDGLTFHVIHSPCEKPRHRH